MFPVLYSRTLLFILSVYNSLHLLIPSSTLSPFLLDNPNLFYFMLENFLFCIFILIAETFTKFFWNSFFYYYSFPVWFITGYWIEFPVLYSRTLFIHLIQASLHLLTSNFQLGLELKKKKKELDMERNQGKKRGSPGRRHVSRIKADLGPSHEQTTSRSEMGRCMLSHFSCICLFATPWTVAW